MPVVVVAGFVFTLRMFAFRTLSCVATLGGLECIVVRAFGVRERHGQLTFQFDRATLGARGLVAAAHEGFELVFAGFADEIENRHDRVGELTLLVRRLAEVALLRCSATTHNRDTCMYKIRSVATIAAVTLGLAFTGASLAAQSPVAKTRGLMVGGHVNGTAIKFGEIKESASDASASASDDYESGPGGGIVVGWGLNKWLMIYAGADVAKIKLKGLEGADDDTFGVVPGDYALVHGDLGARFSYESSNHGFVPYANVAVTSRDASVEVLGEDFSLRGIGLTIGGGMQYFFNPKLALDANVQFTGGKFSEAEAAGVKVDLDKFADVQNSNSARVNLGLRFYPHFGGK